MSKLKILSMCVLLAGCSDESSPDFSHQIDADTFTLYTPDGWTLFEDAGIDTYVGRIAGPRDTIYFDQGFLSFGSLENISEDDQTIYFIHTSVHGVPAIVHKERRENDEGEVRLSVYLDAGDHNRLNRLYVFDPSSPIYEKLMLEIMMTHKFK